MGGGEGEGTIMNSPKASQKRLRLHHQEPDWHSNWLVSLRSPEQANLFAGRSFWRSNEAANDRSPMCGYPL